MNKTIDKHIEILSGCPFNSELFNNKNQGMPLIRIRDLLRSYSDTYFNGEYDSNYIITQNDMLIGMDGDFNVVKWKGEESLLNQRICKISTKKESLHEEYLFQCLQTELNKIHEKTSATTVKHLSVKDIRKISIFFPPLPEQQKIAEILSTVDQKIDSIDSKIEETQTLKRGLMQRLLSEGIGHSEFKESEIGRIPEEWEVANLAKIVKNMHQGINTVTEKINYEDSGIDILQAKHITSGFIDFSDPKKVSEETYKKYSDKYQPLINHILLTNIGTIGKVLLVKSDMKFLIAWNLFLIKADSTLVDPHFLFSIFQRLDSEKYYDKFLTGNATKFINKKFLSDMVIPLPPLHEQQKIAEILSTTDEKLESLRAKKEAFKTLKKGLMQKLLSGEVRVS